MATKKAITHTPIRIDRTDWQRLPGQTAAHLWHQQPGGKGYIAACGKTTTAKLEPHLGHGFCRACEVWIESQAHTPTEDPIRKAPPLRLSTSEPAPEGWTELPPAQIRRDGGTQARAGNNEEVVEEYTAAMREGRWRWHEGNRLVVFFDGADHWLADGFHRTEAAQRADLLSVPVEVRQGSRREAVLYAVGANADHGLRRTREDVRRAIRALLIDEEWRQWSNAELARRARTTDKTVASVRDELEVAGEIPATETRIGADGRTQSASKVRFGNSEPALETFTLEQIAGFAREALARLDFHAAAPFVEAIPDAKLKAEWRGHMIAVRQIATFAAQGSNREAHARAKLITDAELHERLLLATQPALAPPADDLRRDLRSALIAGPHRWKDAQSLIDRVYDFAERSAWQADAARVSTADRVMRQRDAAGAWAALGQIADAELHEALLVLYAGAARELGLTWPPVAPDTKPSLPDGWRWRPGRDSPNYWQAERVADGMLTACGYSPEALAAEARAWDERKPAAAADAPPAAHEPPPPLTALDLQPLMRRAAALGYNVLVRANNVELVARDKTRGETFDDEARLAARIEELEATAATVRTPTPTSARVAPTPADDRATYTAAERALADELAAASPRLRRLLMVACSDGDCERSDATDGLFDYLTDGLLAAESDILVWALSTPAPTPSAGDWPGSDHPDLDDMTAELLGAEMSSDPPAAADVARWQDILDAFAEELSDETYQRLAHRIGVQRALGKAA